jgi:hypothetical protein
VEAFRVEVVCPPACRTRRRVSRLNAVIPQVAGDVPAIRQIRCRIASPITFGRPPLTCINDMLSRTASPWADIRTTIARRNRTGSADRAD